MAWSATMIIVMRILRVVGHSLVGCIACAISYFFGLMMLSMGPVGLIESLRGMDSADFAVMLPVFLGGLAVGAISGWLNTPILVLLLSMALVGPTTFVLYIFFTAITRGNPQIVEWIIIPTANFFVALMPIVAFSIIRAVVRLIVNGQKQGA